MDQADIEGIAVAAVERGGLDPTEPVNPVTLARRLGVRVLAAHWPGMNGAAVLATVCGEPRIYIHPRSCGPRGAHAVAHELAHAVGIDDEDLADRLAAALVAPQPGALRACRAVGPSYHLLGAALGLESHAAALRHAEVTGTPTLVIGKRLRVRGDAYGWPTADGALRGLAKAVPRGLFRQRVDGRVIVRVCG